MKCCYKEGMIPIYIIFTAISKILLLLWGTSIPDVNQEVRGQRNVTDSILPPKYAPGSRWSIKLGYSSSSFKQGDPHAFTPTAS